MKNIRPIFRNSWKKTVRSFCDEIPYSIQEHALEFLMRPGRRIRPLLFLNTVTIDDLAVNDDILDIAVSLECFHTAALIHDDIIDRSNTRRGGPCLHMLIKDHGEYIALVTGDMLIAHGYGLLSGVNLSGTKKQSVIQEISKAIEITGKGEIKELINSEKRLENSEILMQDYDLKTGYYTFTSPVRLAGIIADIEERKMKILEQASESAGRAFQIYNDIKSISGEKSGDDISKGIYTYAMRVLAEKTSKKMVIDLLEKKENRRIKELIIEKQIPLIMKQRADEMYKNTLSLLNDSDHNGLKTFFEENIFQA